MGGRPGPVFTVSWDELASEAERCQEAGAVTLCGVLVHAREGEEVYGTTKLKKVEKRTVAEIFVRTA